MVINIFTFLLIIVLVFWVWRSDHKRGKDTLIRALLSVLSIFLGIFLALSVNSHHDQRQTISNLIRVICVARMEAEENLTMVSQGASIHNDRERLVLESPTTALDVLLDMPTFLEEGSTEIVSELLRLNTQLKWEVTYRPGELGSIYQGPSIVSADKNLVIENLKRVIELLGEQLNLLN